MTFDEWIQKLKEAGERATKGRWDFPCDKITEFEQKQLEYDDGEMRSNTGKSILKSWDYEGYNSGIYVRPDDANFIALSRNEWDTMISLLESYREALEKQGHSVFCEYWYKCTCAKAVLSKEPWREVVE